MKKYLLSVSGSGYFLSLQTLLHLYHVNVLITAITLICFDRYAEEMKRLSLSTAWRASTHQASVIFLPLHGSTKNYEAVTVPHFPKVTLPLRRQVD